MNSPNKLQSSAVKNQDQLSIRNDAIVLIIVFVKKYQFIKGEIISIEIYWKLLRYPEMFLCGFLQSPIFPEGAGDAFAVFSLGIMW